MRSADRLIKEDKTMRSLNRMLLLCLTGSLMTPPGAWAQGDPSRIQPTSVTVTNSSAKAVYANLVLGQPPTVNPPNCTDLGRQIKSVIGPDLVFTSSVPGKPVKFTPWTPGVNDQGYYELAAGETITYQPQTFKCAKGLCSPALTFNFFFTPDRYTGNPNNGCGGSQVFPNATNLAEASINFAINGSAGSGCASADAADISAVNGINSFLEMELVGDSWPFNFAANGKLGTNADRRGVYGWAATGCVSDTGYPNPTKSCSAPVDAPLAPATGRCVTPRGTKYAPISFGRKKYCPELSDSTASYPQGQCVSQRPGGVTGGNVAITFTGFYPASR
jgi:hypothetical protein